MTTTVAMAYAHACIFKPKSHQARAEEQLSGAALIVLSEHAQMQDAK